MMFSMILSGEGNCVPICFVVYFCVLKVLPVRWETTRVYSFRMGQAALFVNRRTEWEASSLNGGSPEASSPRGIRLQNDEHLAAEAKMASKAPTNNPGVTGSTIRNTTRSCW